METVIDLLYILNINMFILQVHQSRAYFETALKQRVQQNKNKNTKHLLLHNGTF